MMDNHIALEKDDFGDRIKSLRQERELTIDQLATRSGVSRAMISRVERGEANPTAQLLARLCHALDTTLSRFFADRHSPNEPLRRHADQPIWRDPETGYARRAVTPDHTGSPVDIVEVTFPPGARVVLEHRPLPVGQSQHLWLLEGRLTMTTGDATHEMEQGDCLFMRLDDVIVFSNPHGVPARYAIVLHRGKG